MKKAKGRAHYERHHAGARLSPTQAILAKCYECTGFYSDGLDDCKMPRCPLYPYMPYGSCPAEKANKGVRAKQGKTLMQVSDEERVTE